MTYNLFQKKSQDLVNQPAYTVTSSTQSKPMQYPGSQNMSLYQPPKPKATPYADQFGSTAIANKLNLNKSTTQPYTMASIYQKLGVKQPVSTPKQVVNPKSPLTQPTPNPFATKPIDLSGITAITDKTKARYGQQNADTNSYINSLYDKTNESLKSQIPLAQGAFNTFKANTEAGIADQATKAAFDRQSVEDTTGAAQRQAAQTRLESEGRLMGQFAANNALDSYGAGSYTAAASSLESGFNQFTQDNLQSKQKQLFDIDSQYRQFERESKGLIASEEAKLNQAIAQINSTVGINELEKEAKLKEAWGAYQDQIDNIDSYLEGLRMEGAKLQNSIAQDVEVIKQLSPEFKATGQPKTEMDMYWVQKNPDSYKSLLEGIKNGGGMNNSKGTVKSLVDELLASNLGPITGAVQLGGSINGTQAQSTVNLFNKLKANLSLDNISKLKGTGAISDKESQLLADASTELGRNLKESEFRAILQKMRNELGGGQQASSGIDANQFIVN